jgi:hypothetical protein
MRCAAGETGGAKGPAAVKCDAATETPVHFVERHIDVKYNWNEWSLRRKALQVRPHVSAAALLVITVSVKCMCMSTR